MLSPIPSLLQAVSICLASCRCVLPQLLCRVLTTTWVEGQTPGQILRCMRSNSNSSSSDTVSTTGAAVAGADTHGSSGHEQQQQQMQGQLLRLVDLGIQASLHQLVVTGVLHADPHPGNLLLSGDRLVFLDFGLLVKVPPEASMVRTCLLQPPGLWGLAVASCPTWL